MTLDVCVIKGEIWEHSYWRGGEGFKSQMFTCSQSSFEKALYLFFTQHSGCPFFSSFLALASPPLQTQATNIFPQGELVQLKGALTGIRVLNLLPIHVFLLFLKH